MKNSYAPLAWLDQQQDTMSHLLQKWADINSSSDNLPGLATMLNELKKNFASLGGEIRQIPLLPRSGIDSQGKKSEIAHGDALHIVKRPKASKRIFLGGHMDTVYPLTNPFQKAELIGPNLMRGPGVADMKGGLVIMLKVLEAFEQSPLAENIGWEIVINPDEEIGSIGSESLIAECATRTSLGLLFEPSFADGAIVSSRKGSINMTVVAKGKAAHAGRDFEKGCNAIAALSTFIVEAAKLSERERGISVNVGCISGGGPVNIVPDLAICRLNARAKTVEDFEMIKNKLSKLASSSQAPGVTFDFYPDHGRCPKIFDDKSQHLADMLQQCAKEEGYELHFRPSGGICDGNILASKGLPVIDTLGAIGGDIHTPNEYLLLDSLVKRARLVTLFLLKQAADLAKL